MNCLSAPASTEVKQTDRHSGFRRSGFGRSGLDVRGLDVRGSGFGGLA